MAAREHAQVRAGVVPEIQAAAFKPKLDRTLRLRAIRRLQSTKAPRPEPAPEPTKKRKSATRKARSGP